MKQWFAITCPICGFRYPLKKFNSDIGPIMYPVQIVTGGGRAKGFKVAEYLPWKILPSLRQTEAWNCLRNLYNRLGAAYDQFYEVLGFLSPKMKKLIILRGSYTQAYRSTPLSEYSRTYKPTLTREIVQAYHPNDYTHTYVQFMLNHLPVGEYII